MRVARLHAPGDIRLADEPAPEPRDDGDKVLTTAVEKKPDLILLDVILPNKNGFQVCRQLKTNAETKDIKVIIVSSKDQASDKFWGMKQGADAYVTKPYDELDLLAAIEKII